MSDRTRNAPEAADDERGVVDLHERKERVLHTRVPESLDRTIKRRARNQGMSVSTVVRNILLNTFGLVEDIVTDSANIALSFTGAEALPRAARVHRGSAAEAERTPTASAILGWQEAVLNLNAVCDHCNVLLAKGAPAAIGVRERPGPRAIICTTCLGKIAAEKRERPRRGRRR